MIVIFDDLFDIGDGLDFRVVHQWNIFVFEDLLPGAFPVEFLYSDHLPWFNVFGFEEGEPLGLYMRLEDAILLHLGLN